VLIRLPFSVDHASWCRPPKGI